MATLGYWSIRGLAQPIRFLLAYLGIEYTHKVYTDGMEWFGKDKLEMDIEFPNLPYYIDGDIKLTQSNAISLYLIKKNKRYDLLGQNEDGSYSLREVRVKQSIGAAIDLVLKIVPLCYNPQFNTIKDEEYTNNIEPQLKKILDFMGEKDFLVDTLSFADFIFYEAVSYISHIYPQHMNTTLKAFKSRFENLQGIKQYIQKPNQNLNVFLPKDMVAWYGPEEKEISA